MSVFEPTVSATDFLPAPVGASKPYWGFRYPAHGWANKPEAARVQHVIDRAFDRGDMILSKETVASIEAEIRHVRQLAQEGKPVVPYLAKRVRKFHARFRQDYYEVQVGSDKHVFVWSRRCNGLISYASKGAFKGDPYRK